VMEDAAGEPLLDKDGRFVPNALTTIFVMRKERGFGADYKELRNGEWEYASYRPDGSFGTQPSATGSCALCHLKGGSLTLSSSTPVSRDKWWRTFLRSAVDCHRRKVNAESDRIAGGLHAPLGIAAGRSGGSRVAGADVRHDRRAVPTAEQRLLGVAERRRHPQEE